ncbi:SMP-30/gluconolactonase/LRE family protein [Pollutimonas bauzanensis]|uniref:Gluconolactonase n=1 Tax=Pollutimonas bauzanensis TaxID=658167 RepID=A0A1M6B000_9BURK|nr:SMP-30/gluconolactonase/LRE family protein [Pollutimonas bauzanensis]SHI42050.1 gluconolactonase [Pollutimonas bauzanensis]
MTLHLAPPRQLGTTVFATLPDRYRKNQTNEWSDANQGGKAADSFLEGPVCDAAGNLFVADIPFGRIFRIDRHGEWSLLVEYDGWPNGLAMKEDGTLLICDYRKGLLSLDPGKPEIIPVLARRHSESFKGLNDLCIARDGTVYFTDQGQTGMHDPTGRVFRLAGDGRLDCLLSNMPSPNGIALSQDEKTLFVAATRANSVWRVPLMPDGSVAKVGVFCNTFGPGGPDGLCLDESDNLMVAHVGLGHIFVFSPRGELTHALASATGANTTNIALGPARGGGSPRLLYITEAQSGTVLAAPWPGN